MGMFDDAEGIVKRRRNGKIIFIVETSDFASDKIDLINHKIKSVSDYFAKNENADMDAECALLSFSDKPIWMYRKFFKANDFDFKPLKSGGSCDIESAFLELIEMLSKLYSKKCTGLFPPVLCVITSGKISFSNETFSKIIGNEIFRILPKIIITLKDNINLLDVKLDHEFMLLFSNIRSNGVSVYSFEPYIVPLVDFSSWNIEDITEILS